LFVLPSNFVKRLFSFVVVILTAYGFAVPFSYAADTGVATLYIGPGTGTFTVGSTFTVSFYVNTGGKFINAVEASILFPADRLQVVSPSTGASFINVWAIQPSYSNTEGTMNFRGAVPSPGINTSAGLISTVTFRVKAVGSAVIRFGSDSHVLLNDGLGTDVLQHSESGVYTLVLPPPSGPFVVSDTHPDQSRWYSNDTVGLSWAGDVGASSYSYILSDQPVDVPDNIPEGQQSRIVYKKLSNGRHYFHIKALRAGVWGGATHYAVSVDTLPPAEFPIDVVPSARTAQHQPVINFLTTDAESGLDRYEIRVIGLAEKSADVTSATDKHPFFIEAQSPYIPQSLPFGRYDVFVRAYDIAGNYREVTQRLEIVPTLFEIVQGRGIEFRQVLFIPWPVFWGAALIVLLALGFIVRKYRRHHHGAVAMRQGNQLPDDISVKLAQLKEYQAKYGNMAAVLLAVVVLSLFSFVAPVRAEQVALPPPVITTVSKDIFNDEIFYVGGHTNIEKSEVIVYIQNSEGGQTLSYHVPADDAGDWFYRHSTFLPSGAYLVWAQVQDGQQMSPPSPQVSMVVASHAVRLGLSRISYETIYVITIVVLLIVLILLCIMWMYHYYHGKRKHARLMSEHAKIEESIRRGFALLHRDISEELAVVHGIALTRELTEDQRRREEQLLKDLDVIKRNIGEEVWQLGKLE
jgi:hypothetical protein